MITVADAMKIINKHQVELPIRVHPIAEELGINIYRMESWPKNLSGKLQKDENSKSKFSIYVNASDSNTRQRFTIAHEIAHFILHRDMIKGDALVDDALYRSGLSNAIEADANKMAADILMPWHLVNKAINDGTTTIDALAKKFNVSNSAMAIRLGIPD